MERRGWGWGRIDCAERVEGDEKGHRHWECARLPQYRSRAWCVCSARGRSGGESDWGGDSTWGPGLHIFLFHGPTHRGQHLLLAALGMQDGPDFPGLGLRRHGIRQKGGSSFQCGLPLVLGGGPSQKCGHKQHLMKQEY